ncbi:hypothetical protein EYE40_12625 [Glaciihabitans arcticus]|uniref:Uncharacterized protein n=1 Tax=Glaciihabitans arcticus TaxID=2668039 RepID=A0A4Q9GVA4_9MICO|nr:hypothetical protein [Glaciihabitans arcticus]TBN58164.1 hypothetical protein EYE40_12625 [Glaciihabitans arcticus]
MTDLAKHPLLAGLREGSSLRWSQSNGDFDMDHSAFEQVEVSITDATVRVRARTDLDMLSFYWDADPAQIEDDKDLIRGFLGTLPGVIVDPGDENWETYDIWVDVTPDSFDVALESVFDVLDVAENHPSGARFAELLDVRPGEEVIAFWTDLRRYLESQRVADGSAADAGPVAPKP